MRLLLPCALLVASPLHAAEALIALPVATAPDADRLAAARRLVEQVMPTADRDRMIGQMITPIMANLGTALRESPQFAALSHDDPRVADIVREFLREQQERSIGLLRETMPAMIEAMARAYARRLTVSQLNEVSAFFATPAGRAYLQQAPTIMADPDVATWMREMTTRAMADLPRNAKTLADKLRELRPDGKSK